MPPATEGLRATSDRLDGLLRELDAHPDPAIRNRVREVVALLMEIHRDGLERVLELASDATPGSSASAEAPVSQAALFDRLADDALIGPLLLVHHVHPFAAEVRLARALDRLRPRIAAHGCRATLSGIDDSVARVRLEGGARLSSRSELQQAIETCLMEAAPELTAVILDAANTDVAAPSHTPLIQILRHPPSAAAAGPEP